MSNACNLTRRAAIQIGAMATGVAAVGVEFGFASEYKPKFFSPEEFVTLDELTELIIPADDHSPGARAAGVAAFIDGRLAESIDDTERNEWQEGLKRIDILTRELYSVPFMQATPDERIALLTQIAKDEQDPRTPDQRFFVRLKSATASAYYSSKIGIHQEMEYKGNVLLPEFLGYEVK